MQLKIFNNYYDVVILKKKTTKNTYIRVKDDLKIYITCNYYTKDSYIKKLIEDNQEKIVKMLNDSKRKPEPCGAGLSYSGLENGVHDNIH